MSTTLNRETTNAVSFFKAKLEYEIGPYGIFDAQKNKEPLRIIDLRTPEHYAKGHIPGAVNVQFDELSKYASQLKKDETVVVYCYNITCHLAAKAALLLAERDIKVKELFGGYQEYANSGLAQEGSEQASTCSTAKGSSCA
jgi:rhodanese-related sulfurtransferase